MANFQIVKNFSRTLTAAGTAEEVSTTQLFVRSAILQAHPGNTDNVYVGGVGTTDSDAHALAPGAALTLQGDAFRSGLNVQFDLNKVEFDGDTNGNKLTVTYFEEVI